jgi:hypothetical protein
MKYFKNLPSRTFESTIGKFVISDFFSYYDIGLASIDTQDYVIDDKSTLIEASQKIYNDNNSMWLFLLANGSIDPFNLTAYNVTLYTEANKDKITTQLVKQTLNTSIVSPESSIVAPYVAASGNSWSYSSVGNFDLNGPFTLVESTNYKKQEVTLKPQKIETFIQPTGSTAGEILSIIQKGLTSTQYTGITTAAVIKSKSSKLEQTLLTQNSSTGNIDIDLSDTAPLPIIAISDDDVLTTHTTDENTVSVTEYETVVDANKNIKIFIPYKVNSILGKLITFK